MSARDRILAKLKANAPATAGELPDVATWYATHRSAESNADKAKRFRHFIELAHAEVYAVSRGGWLQKLYEVLSAKQIDQPPRLRPDEGPGSSRLSWWSLF